MKSAITTPNWRREFAILFHSQKVSWICDHLPMHVVNIPKGKKFICIKFDAVNVEQALRSFSLSLLYYMSMFFILNITGCVVFSPFQSCFFC